MPDLVVAGHWKMNTTVSEAAALAVEVRDGAAGVAGVDLVLCPAAISQGAVGDAVTSGGVSRLAFFWSGAGVDGGDIARSARVRRRRRPSRAARGRGSSPPLTHEGRERW